MHKAHSACLENAFYRQTLVQNFQRRLLIGEPQGKTLDTVTEKSYNCKDFNIALESPLLLYGTEGVNRRKSAYLSGKKDREKILTQSASIQPIRYALKIRAAFS